MTSPMQLLACKRCRFKKLKCDKTSPRCSACEKSNTACIILDPDTGEEYPREAVAQLEYREKWLREAIAAEDDIHHEAPAAPATPKKTLVGPSSDIGSLDGMFSHPRWASLKTHLLEQLRDSQSLSIRPPDLPAAELPSRERAEYLVSSYLRESQIHKAFLSRQIIVALVSDVYDRPAAEGSTPRPQDVFRLFMICAVSATILRHKAPSETHPYSYFVAAQGYLDRIPLVQGFDAILNLLLIARFGVYYYIGTSIWALSRICMRTCLHLELHLPPLVPLDPLEEQRRRFVFWDCYVNDRYSSIIMGRPFSISDADIKVGLPVPYADEDIAKFGVGQLDSMSTYLPASRKCQEASTAISYITIHRISSRARRIFQKLESSSFGPGKRKERVQRTSETRIQLRELLEQVQKWREDCPFFQDMSCLYMTQDWYDVLAAKERLSLVRAAISVTGTGVEQPPDEFIQLCRQSAQQVISVYAGLYDAVIVRPTRGYFQTLLIAGLSIIFCISSCQQSSGSGSGSGARSPMKDGGSAGSGEDASCLQTCSRILWGLSDEMPDARSFACAFDLVREHIIPGSTARQIPNQNQSQPAQPPSAEAQLLQAPQMEQLPPTSLQNTLPNPEDALADPLILPPDVLGGMEADVNLFACGDGSSYLWSSLGIPGRNPAPGELYW